MGPRPEGRGFVCWGGALRGRVGGEGRRERALAMGTARVRRGPSRGVGVPCVGGPGVCRGWEGPSKGVACALRGGVSKGLSRARGGAYRKRGWGGEGPI